MSHKVISTLLHKTCEAARADGVNMLAVQKPNEADGCEDAMVRQVTKNELIADALASRAAQVAAGTASSVGSDAKLKESEIRPPRRRPMASLC